MKKNLLTLMSLFVMSANMLADGLTATLQQGDNMKAFYGMDAFKQAYQEADSGAVITLSSGKFNDVSTISKPITLIGAYAFAEYSPTTTFLGSTTISANNVKVEGIYFIGTVTIGGVTNTHIKRCWTNNLTSTANHTNTLIDQCVVGQDGAIANGNNYCIKNSTISHFSALNTISNLAYITNCVIWAWRLYSGGSWSNTYVAPFAIYKNNVIGIYSNSSSNYLAALPSEFYYNLFINTYDSSKANTVAFPYGMNVLGNITGKNYSSYYSSTSSFPASDMKSGTSINGQDGTPIGIKGGTGFSEWPSIPRITSKTIDSSTDAEGKINVKIAVKVEQ